MSSNDEVQIEEDDYEKLVDGFDTTTILGAVDGLDELRGAFSDRENGAPLELRDDLLKLHQLAMDVVNNEMRSQALEMFVLAGDVESELGDLITRLEEVRGAIEVLTDLCPDYLHDA